MEIPQKIRERLNGAEYRTDDVGLSGASVFLFQDRVLKISEAGEESEREYRILMWLKGRLPVPEVLCREVCGGKDYLLMTRLSGVMSCDRRYMERPRELISVLAEGLKRLWSLDVSGCPCRYGLEERLKAAEKQVEQGRVDVKQTEPETFGANGFRSPLQLLEWLQENRPEEDLAFSHGDYCLPNIFARDGRLSGFLDLGRAGVADRYQDIALCWRSLRHNYDGKYGGDYSGIEMEPELLFEELGIEPDWRKIRYYILLDELF